MFKISKKNGFNTGLQRKKDRKRLQIQKGNNFNTTQGQNRNKRWPRIVPPIS